MGFFKRLSKKAIGAVTGLYFLAAAAGCGGSSGGGSSNGGNITPPRTNNPPGIATQALEDTVAGEYYKKIISATDADSDSLKFYLSNSPPGMQINENTGELTWSPRHSNIGPNYSQTGTFDVGIYVSDGKSTTSKDFTLKVALNLTGDGLTSDYIKTNNTIRLKCQAPCGATNDQDIDEHLEGTLNVSKDVLAMIGIDIPAVYKPVELHVEGDSTCDPNLLGGFSYSFRTADKAVMCVFRPKDANGRLLHNMWTTSLKDKNDKMTEGHELIHVASDGKPNDAYGTDGYKFWESIASAIAAIVTDNAGSMTNIDSFCQPQAGNPSFPVARYLCTLNGFDVANLPALFNGPRTSSVQDAKCIIDGTKQQNTYQAFSDAGIAVEDIYCGN